MQSAVGDNYQFTLQDSDLQIVELEISKNWDSLTIRYGSISITTTDLNALYFEDSGPFIGYCLRFKSNSVAFSVSIDYEEFCALSSHPFIKTGLRIKHHH